MLCDLKYYYDVKDIGLPFFDSREHVHDVGREDYFAVF